MSDADAKQFDVVIFGATGYTGRYVIEELAKVVKGRDVKWAIAGRNREKLKASLESVQQYLEDDLNIMSTAILEADVDDQASISEMCKKAKLILNCVGPYKLYGEVVVAACIENGTHHVDISGEMKYLETTQANYFNDAREKKIYIVQACGFDSIPADLGIAVLKDKFPGGLNSVESYVQFLQGSEGRVTNIGTWMSAVHSVCDVLNSRKYTNLLKEKVFTKEIPKSNFNLRKKPPVFFSDIVKGWCFWFMGPDERVIKRSQMFAYQFLDEKPVQANAYIRMDSFLIAMSFLFFIAMFGAMSLFSAGRYLLGKFPSFFSAGLFSTSGPTRKQVKQSSLKMTLCGEGWSQPLLEPSDQRTESPDKRMKLTITGPDPAYDLTSICMVHAGLTILEENDKMPLQGGVLTPGIAFAKTTLMERLEKRGISFAYE